MPQERQHATAHVATESIETGAAVFRHAFRGLARPGAGSPFGRSGDLLELAHRPCENADYNEGEEGFAKVAVSHLVRSQRIIAR
jgi:hypothetical protein